MLKLWELTTTTVGGYIGYQHLKISEKRIQVPLTMKLFQFFFVCCFLRK